MNLYKLTGYNPETDTYINPDTGEQENLPNTPFKILDAQESGYELFDGADAWGKYAINLVGCVYGLREYLSLRYEIYTRIESIAGTNYANYDSLNPSQERIALEWCNVRIVNAKDFSFYIQKCGSQEVATNYLDNFLDNSYNAREIRYYNAFTIFGYTYLGKAQGLKAESYARKDFLDSTYLDRGVVYKADDGIDGIGDWIMGNNGYSVTGLKPRIIAGEFILGGGMTVDTFCNILVGVLNDGEF